jgi:glycosyltransferase involved in cell wall biosynthesis
MHPHAPAYDLRRQCLTRIKSLSLKDRILFVNDYLDDDESLSLLAGTDLVVYPYQGTSESSSAAIRFGLASHRPVAITPVDIFEDVRDLCHILPGITPVDIGSGINHLLSSRQVLDSRKEIRQRWLKTHSWRFLARRLDAMIHALTQDHSRNAQKTIDSGIGERKNAA